jgi:hypothetical protein
MKKEDILKMSKEELEKQFNIINNFNNCYYQDYCNDCFDCNACYTCNNCDNCNYCNYCYDCDYCIKCDNCKNLVNGIYCSNLMFKQKDTNKYYVLNIKVTKEEFEEVKEKIKNEKK